MNKEKKLFDQFPPVSTSEWMEKITTDLKGADFRKRLIWKMQDGIEVMPFYRQENTADCDFHYLKEKKKSGNNWRIRQNIEVNDYRKANTEALDILMKGVDSLGFVINDPETITTENLRLLLKDIVPEAVEINFFSNGKAIEIATYFLQYLEHAGISTESVFGAVETDPLGRLMVNGTLCIPPEKGFDYLEQVINKAIPLRNFRAIDIKASSIVNAGADISNELAIALSMGTEYINQLAERGISPENTSSKIRFTFGIGSNYFPEIAKLRAARRLWAVVMHGFVPENEKASIMEIHSVTAHWNKTIYDSYVNMLRTQTEAMSAVIGGADSITVEPFDTVFRNPDNFSKRIARNQQLILKEESYFDMVADPSAGSYYIENLTSLIADKAWKIFVDIEEHGGFLEALKKGFVQKIINESADTRKSDVSKRKAILLGTNIFPDLNDKIPEGADLRIAFVQHSKGDNLLCEPVFPSRGSEIFERIRLEVEKARTKPTVFLFTIGDIVMRKARARFASEFFGCAGYRIIDNPGFKSVSDGIEAALKTNADIFVLCSSDDEYSGYAPEIFNHLKNKGLFVIAGNPACADVLKATGIEYFISIKSDVGATLQMFNKLLGIS